MKNLLTLVFAVLIAGTSIGQLDRSKAPKPQPNPEIKIDIPEAITLDNGLKVIIVENHKLPRVSFQMFCDSPNETEGDLAGISGIFGQLLGSGTATLSKDQFDAKVDYMGADVFPTASGFYASSLKKHTPALLELVSEMIKSPALPQEELDRIKEQQNSALQQSKNDPNSMASTVAGVVNYGKTHPYGEVTTEKTIEKITLDDVKKYYKDHIMPNIAYLIVVGDVTQDEGKEFATKYFGDWAQGTPQKEMSFELPERTGSQVYFVDKPAAVQSVISVTHTIDLKPGHEDVVKVSILNKILGGGGFAARLMANLREDKAYTYGCYSSFSPNRLVGNFSAGGSFRNEVTDSAIVEILKEIKLITEEIVKDEEIELAKNSITGAFARNLESPQTLAGYALNTVRYNLPADYYQTYLQKIEAVTKEDLLEMAKKYLSPDNLNIVVAGNAEISENLLKFDSNNEITYLDHYGEPASMLKEVPNGITAKSVLENFTLKSLNAVSTTEIPAKLKKIGYIKVTRTASFEAMGATLEMQIHKANTNKTAQQWKAKSAMGSQVMLKAWFNGESGGSVQMGQLKMLEGDELEAAKVANFPFKQMHYFDNPYLDVTLMGIDEVDGKEYYKIKVLDKNNDEFSYEYYALDGGMLTIEESFAKDQDGNTITNITRFEDYKDVNGIMIPHTFIMQLMGQEMEFTTSEVIVKKKGKTEAFKGSFD